VESLDELQTVFRTIISDRNRNRTTNRNMDTDMMGNQTESERVELDTEEWGYAKVKMRREEWKGKEIKRTRRRV
jgi:hypothetical protein